MLSNEFGKKSDDEILEDCVLMIYKILKQDLNVSECNDTQCDNEDCVLYNSVKNYIKYNSIKIKRK
jgi:hypothetical protein